MPIVELLTVANHAEAINGLLYLSGAGWTDLRRPITPDAPLPVTHIGVGVAFLVPWAETNYQHNVSLRIESADGAILLQAQGQFELGRPAGLAPGSDLRTVLAFTGEIVFPAAGIYRVVATVAEDDRSVTFRVHDVPVPAAPRPPGQ